MLSWGISLLVLALVTYNFASEQDACTSTCLNSPTRSFRYLSNVTYEYSFESATKISLSNTSESTTTKIKATVLLAPVSACSYLLALENVRIVEADSRFKHGRIPGAERPIQFSIQNGIVNDHICVEPDEDTNALNIKRAIVSLFQTNTDESYTTDIFGTCFTRTKKSPVSKGLVLRNKDLSSCTTRKPDDEDLSVPPPSPVLNGKYVSRQKTKDGILVNADVVENHIYLPFINDGGSEVLKIKAKVRTKLEYLGNTQRRLQSNASEPRPIVFDSSKPPNTDRSDVATIVRAVENVKTSELIFHENSARAFLDLVKILRATKTKDLVHVFGLATNGTSFSDEKGARRVFTDALFRCGTEEALAAGVQLLKTDQLDSFEEKLLYLSFGFVRHPTLAIIQTASSFLEASSLPREAYLSIGNLLGRYCRRHRCKTDDEIRGIVTKLSTRLDSVHTSVTKVDENAIMLTLKILANIGYLDDPILAKISNIARNKDFPARLRVAALETFLFLSCNDAVRTAALNILRDDEEDSEIRIKAYLALAQCPDGDVAKSVETLLEHDLSYQVKSFIVSHLATLRNSTDLSKAQRYLRGIVTETSPFDPHKYSVNFVSRGFPYGLPGRGISTLTETSVIYSQKSFLPRSVGANVALELFSGKAAFLEIQARQENLNVLLERYLGPLGELNKMGFNEVYMKGNMVLNKLRRSFFSSREKNRGKRSSETSSVDDHIKFTTEELRRQLEFDLSVKLFGSELFFASFNHDINSLSLNDFLDGFLDSYGRDLTRVNFKKNFQASTIFTDLEHRYPTSMGFPLRLSIEGAAAVQVRAEVNADLRGLFDRHHNNSTFKLSFIPSASIEIGASLTLDAQAESGFEIASNFYIGTGGDLEVKLENQRPDVAVKFSFPIERQKLVSTTQRVVAKSREPGKSEIIRPIDFGESKATELCMTDLKPYVGLDICTKKTSTAGKVGSLFDANYKYVIAIDNEDFSHINFKKYYNYRKYVATTEAEVIAKEGNKKTSIIFETSGASTAFSVVSPIMTVLFKIKMAGFSGGESLVSFEVHRDNHTFSGKAGVNLLQTGDKQELIPILEISVPGTDGRQETPINVQGSIIVEDTNWKERKVTFKDLRLHIASMVNDSVVTYSVDGETGYAGDDHYTNVVLSDGSCDVRINGRMHREKDLLDLHGQIENTYDPDLNLYVVINYNSTRRQSNNFLQIVHGPDANSTFNKLTVDTYFLHGYRRNDSVYDTIFENRVSHAATNFEGLLDFKMGNRKQFGNLMVKNDACYIDLKFNETWEDDLRSSDTSLTFTTANKNLDANATLNYVKEYVSDREVYDFDLLLKMPLVQDPFRIKNTISSNAKTVDILFETSNVDGSKDYARFDLTSSTHEHGATLEITLEDLIVVNGYFSQKRGAGNGEVVVEFVKQSRIMKANTRYSIDKPIYNIDLIVYPHFKRIPDYYVGIRTENEIEDTSVKSHNVLNLSGRKIAIDGAYFDRDHKSFVSGSVSVPNGAHGAFRYDCHSEVNSGSRLDDRSLGIDVRRFYSWKDVKVTFTETLRDVDSEGVYNHAYKLAAFDGEGGAAHVEFNTDRAVTNQEILAEATIKIYGGREEDGLVVSGRYRQAKTNSDEFASGIHVRYRRSKADLSIDHLDMHRYIVDYAQIIDDFDPLTLVVKLEELNDGNLYRATTTAAWGPNRLETLEELDLSDETPGFRVHIVYPNGKADEILAQMSLVQNFESKIKVYLHAIEFAFDGMLHTENNRLSDLVIVATANCPTWNLNDFTANLSIELPGSGKEIAGGNESRDPDREKHLRIIIRNNAEDLFGAGVSYRVHEEDDRFTVEGGGTYQIRGESSKPVHGYKIIMKKLYGDLNDNNGVDYSWNVKLGLDTIDGKLTSTEKEFLFSTAVCSVTSLCERVEASSRMSNTHGDDYVIDRRVFLHVPTREWNEVELTEKTDYRGTVFDISGELCARNKSLYQYNAYRNMSAFGASLTTPVRIVALEAKVESLRKPNAEFGSARFDLYLDKKNQPHELSSLVGLYDCSDDVDVGKCNVEMKFVTPALPKELTVFYSANYDYPQLHAEHNLAVDVFNRSGDDIVCTGRYSGQKLGWSEGTAFAKYEIKSQGLGIDLKFDNNLNYTLESLAFDSLLRHHVGVAAFDNQVALQFAPERSHFLVKALDKDILSVNVEVAEVNDLTLVTGNVSVIGTSTSAINVTVWNDSLVCDISLLDNPSKGVVAHARAFEDRGFSLDVSYKENDRPTKILLEYARPSDVDSSYKYTYKKENIQEEIVAPLVKEYANFENELGILKENAKEYVPVQARQTLTILRSNLFDLGTVTQYYEKELNNFGEELFTDIKSNRLLHSATLAAGRVLQRITDVVNYFAGVLENFLVGLVNLWGTFAGEVFNNIRPWLRKSKDKVSAAYDDITEDLDRSLRDAVDGVINEVSDFTVKYQQEVHKVAFFIMYGVEDSVRSALPLKRNIEELIGEGRKRYERVKEFVEKFDERLQEVLQDQPVPEFYIKYFRELSNSLIRSTKSSSLRVVLRLFTEHIVQNLRGRPVGRVDAGQNVLMAIFSILGDTYRVYDYKHDLPGISWDDVYDAMVLQLRDVKFSPFYGFRFGELGRLFKLLDAAVFDLIDWSQLENFDGVIVQGRHVFTFDGKYFTFPGSCDYLLAYDIVDGNFSISGNYEDGSLVSLTFTDKHHTVLIGKGGRATLDGAVADLPIHTQHRLKVHRDFDAISLESEAGVRIMCHPDLLVCSFRISGYYHDRLRGLLGNGNREPYDDYTTPDGLTAASEADFGNSYRLQESCDRVSMVNYEQTSPDSTCDPLFNSNSSLRFCFDITDSKNFQTACSRGASNRSIAIAYTAKCRSQHASAYVPHDFVKCDNYDKPTEVYEKFTAATSAAAIDIVVMIDQHKANEPIFKELMKLLAEKLVDTFDTKGVKDVHFHFIGYGGEHGSPVHYTMDGELILRFGEIPKLQFSDPGSAIKSYIEYLRITGKQVKLPAAEDRLFEAYQEALDYPFRSHAVKSIIIAKSKSCYESYRRPYLRSPGVWLARDEQVIVNLFSLSDCHRPGDLRDVIGFNKNSTFTFTKPEGDSEHSRLRYDSTVVDLALRNGGNVFVLNNFDTEEHKKELVQVAAKLMVEKLANAKQQLKCECEVVSPYRAQNVCQISEDEREGRNV